MGNSTQQEIYEVAAQPVVQGILDGFNGTVFAYGQTSSGKTYTMQGPSIYDQEQKGIIPRIISAVFSHVNNSPKHIKFEVKLSIVEIYLEKIKDLLDVTKINLSIREDRARGVYIQDVTERHVSNEQEVFEIIRSGNANRSVASTNMNEESSRSHMLFIMTIHQKNLEDFSSKSGKLCLVDLAGSEKISKTGAEGKTLDEAKKINQSLSALGKVIFALTDGKSQHIPYRDSKLTRVLSESLGGNSRTSLIITCSPSSFNDQETLSTLRFGMRAKNIENKPIINKEQTTQELLLIIQNQEKLIEEQRIKIEYLEKIEIPFEIVEEGSSGRIMDILHENSNHGDSSLINEIEKEEENEKYTNSDLSVKDIELDQQLSESRRQLKRMESQVNGIYQANEFMTKMLNQLATNLNDLEAEMNGRSSSADNLEQINEMKQQVSTSITELRRFQIDLNEVKEEKAIQNHQFEKNQHILDKIGLDQLSFVDKDLLLACQAKLDEVEFRLFLDQLFVLGKTDIQSIKRDEFKEQEKQENNQQMENDMQGQDKIFKEQELISSVLIQEQDQQSKNKYKSYNEIFSTEGSNFEQKQELQKKESTIGIQHKEEENTKVKQNNQQQQQINKKAQNTRYIAENISSRNNKQQNKNEQKERHYKSNYVKNQEIFHQVIGNSQQRNEKIILKHISQHGDTINAGRHEINIGNNQSRQEYPRIYNNYSQQTFIKLNEDMETIYDDNYYNSINCWNQISTADWIDSINQQYYQQDYQQEDFSRIHNYFDYFVNENSSWSMQYNNIVAGNQESNFDSHNYYQLENNEMNAGYYNLQSYCDEQSHYFYSVLS